MKKPLLIATAALAAATSLGSLAARTGDPIAVQERENQRVAEEKQHMRDMHMMMERCSAMMGMMEKMMRQSN